MTTDIKTPQLTETEPEEILAVHPRKFLLWLAIVSIVMMFAAFTSAYLVRKAEGNWLEFEMPRIFWYSTGVMLLSSLSMSVAHWAAKKDRFGLLKVAISITFVLGILFLALQFEGWKQLVGINVYFVGNPSGSFLYVLSGMHGLHIVSGLVVLVVALVSAFRMSIHAKNLTRIWLAATYWHFLDVLWIYLFVFLLYNN
ncbi:MAG: cytochrome c oxidase subunit 3 [Sphingobacteriaceae bacterium]|nr:cytochrome c oxidase subunit 3 [Cytophagaceae bacterium]